MTHEELKSSLVEKLPEFNFSKAQADEIIKAVHEAEIEGLLKDRVCYLKGIGTLKLINRAERTGKNPKTGEPLTIPAHDAIKLSTSKSLKERIK